MKTKSPLSYFGSDAAVARDLAALLDHCRHVTIPFAGGLSILPYIKASAVVANDIHGDVINFYRHAAGRHGLEKQEELLAMCQTTLSHPQEMEDAIALLCDSSLANSVQRAWAFWASCWIGRKGKCGTKHMGGAPSVRRTPEGGSNATRIRSAAKDLLEWTQQFARCEFETSHYPHLLTKVADRPDCGIYVDPPWITGGRNYLHSFTESDHRDLAILLRRFTSTTVVVRYGDEPLVRELYSDWKIVRGESRNQANRPNRELWLINQHSELFAHAAIPVVHIDPDLLSTCERCGREYIDGRQDPSPICDDCTAF